MVEYIFQLYHKVSQSTTESDSNFLKLLSDNFGYYKFGYF